MVDLLEVLVLLLMMSKKETVFYTLKLYMYCPCIVTYSCRTSFMKGDTKNTPAYSSDLHFHGTKIQLSILSSKIGDLQHWGRKK